MCRYPQFSMYLMIRKLKNMDIKQMPVYIMAILFSVSPEKKKQCVVWSLPPIKGDFPFFIRLITTEVVSMIGIAKVRMVRKNCLVCTGSTFFWIGFQKYMMPIAARKRPRNWLP